MTFDTLSLSLSLSLSTLERQITPTQQWVELARLTAVLGLFVFLSLTAAD